MIIERKVIDLITAEAKFKGTKYEAVQKEDTTALEFFAAGGTAVAIPDAKYDESEPQSLPTIKERD